MDDQNATRRLLQALAGACPDPVPTTALARLYADVHPCAWPAALNHTGWALRRHKAHGLVRQAGWVPGNRHPGPPTGLWKITEQGLMAVYGQCPVPAIPHVYPCWDCAPASGWGQVSRAYGSGW